jgi:predicted alpha/beta hydrolase family esterase
MATNIFIFHGTEGYPGENWFPWLKNELEQKGYNVIVPQFPSPPVIPAKIDEWFAVLKDYEKFIDEETIIVGHSLGGVFTLRVLEKLDSPIKAAVLVGAPIGVRPILNYDRDEAFSGFDFNWNKIASHAQEFIVYQSDTDPYVDIRNGQELAAKLGVDMTFVANAGHFNKPAGYTHFQDLLDKLLSILK